MFYIFSLSNNQGDTSKVEDYENYLDKRKRDDERYYSKSEDEIIWEALCSFSDPKLVEKVKVDFEAAKNEDDEGMIINDHSFYSNFNWK